MYFKLTTFSYIMGMSKSADIFLSEKDLESMEFNFLVSPTLQFPDESHIAHSDVGHDDQPHDQDHQEVQTQVPEEEDQREESEEREENFGIVISSLEIKVPSIGEFKNDDEEEKEEEDGLRTPTSLVQRIPLIPTCPPAPRKPRSFPSTKRKAPPHRKILLDLSNEIQTFFTPAILSDSGNKIKKAKGDHCTK